MQGDSNKIGSQTDIDVYMIPVQRTSEKFTVMSSNSSESRINLVDSQRFYAEISYDEYTSEFRHLSTGDVQLRDKKM